MARKGCLMLGACGECCGYIILLYSNLNIYKTIASARKLQEAHSFHKITLSDCANDHATSRGKHMQSQKRKPTMSATSTT